MATCYITNWTGRTGNNILQVARCLYYATKHRFSRVIFPQHRLFKQTEILLDISASDARTDGAIVRSSFFYLQKDLGEPEPAVGILRALAQRYMIAILKIPIPLIKPAGDRELVIHIRSGDIFDVNPHPAYVQPPLWFYTSVIRKHETAKVVYEDMKNPCAAVLTQRYSSQSETMERDLVALLAARNAAVGYGTFGLMVFLLSQNLKRIYVPAYAIPNVFPGDTGDVEVIGVELPGYIRLGEWKNTPAQRSLMLSYEPPA